MLSDNSSSRGASGIFLVPAEHPPSLANCTTLQNPAPLLFARNADVSSGLRNAWEHFQRAEDIEKGWEKIWVPYGQLWSVGNSQGIYL